MTRSRHLLADSITTLPGDAAGSVVVCGSHGGAYPAMLALAANLRAVVFNDAGGGLDGSGRACLAIGDAYGLPACTVDTHSCRIGDAADMVARGRLSGVNGLAVDLDVGLGMGVAAAVEALAHAAPREAYSIPHPEEARTEIGGMEPPIVLVDSASLVHATDAGSIIITGSHGGLIGGDPARALKADAHFVLFNDGGMGAGNCGIMRLPALDARGIAAACVASASARIGDARSTWQDGVVSAVNETAARMGVRIGDRAVDAVEKAGGGRPDCP